MVSGVARKVSASVLTVGSYLSSILPQVEKRSRIRTTPSPTLGTLRAFLVVVLRRLTSTVMMEAMTLGDSRMNSSRSSLVTTMTLESSRAMAVAVRAPSSRKRATSPKMEMGLRMAKTFLCPSTMPDISILPSVRMYAASPWAPSLKTTLCLSTLRIR